MLDRRDVNTNEKIKGLIGQESLLKRLKTHRVFRFRVEKWWWVSHLPAVVLLYFFWPGLWDKVSILYLVLVSIYALVITAAGGEHVAEAAKEDWQLASLIPDLRLRFTAGDGVEYQVHTTLIVQSPLQAAITSFNSSTLNSVPFCAGSAWGERHHLEVLRRQTASDLLSSATVGDPPLDVARSSSASKRPIFVTLPSIQSGPRPEHFAMALMAGP